MSNDTHTHTYTRTDNISLVILVSLVFIVDKATGSVLHTSYPIVLNCFVM